MPSDLAVPHAVGQHHKNPIPRVFARAVYHKGCALPTAKLSNHRDILHLPRGGLMDLSRRPLGRISFIYP